MTSTDRERGQGQTVPHDLEAEAALLGAMMLAADAIRAATTANITLTDFYKPEHSTIFQAIIDTATAGEGTDPITVGARHPDIPRARLLELQTACPASYNGPAYARIVRDLARRRELIAIANAVSEAAREGGDATANVARLMVASTTTDSRQRVADGATFTLDIPATVPAVWGADDRVLWAQGEELLIVGPPGVGKTTIAAQLVAARLGITDRLLDLPVNPAQRVLYLACDRPSQIQRAFNRLFGDEQHREILAERLVVWKGPPPRDFARQPDILTALARDHGADCVFIDSLKDVALGISDDEVGAGLNSSVQQALADGIDVCGLHHQRKGKDGAKPKTLEDVYGSIWVTAGAGSVILLWGQPGDPLVELVHLKQPAAEVGPLQVDHDHNKGRSTVSRGDVDPLRVLRTARQGMTAHDLAVLNTGKEKPTDVERRKAKRTLDRLVDRGLAHVTDGTKSGGPGGTVPDRYHATVAEPDAPTARDYTSSGHDDEIF